MIKSFLKIFGVAVHRSYFISFDLSDPIKTIEPPISLETRPASDEEIKRIIMLKDKIGNELYSGLNEHAAKNRHTCIIALHDGKIAGYSWIIKDRIEFTKKKVKALKGGAYSYNSFVFPEFRGKKVFQKLIERSYWALKDEGYDFCCNLVNVENIASVKAREKFGESISRVWIIENPVMRPLIIGKIRTR